MANTNPWLGRLPTTLGLSLQSAQAARKDVLSTPLQQVYLTREVQLFRDLRADLLVGGINTFWKQR